MAKQTPGKRFTLFAVTLLSAGLFVAVALAAQPAEETSTLPGFYPQLFGAIGGEIQGALIEPLGAAAFVLVLGWLVVAVTLLRQRRWFLYAQRILGWTVLTLAASVLADAQTERLGSALAGGGGDVGAAGTQWLNAHFQHTGKLLLVIAALLLGLVLAADYLVMWAVRAIRTVGGTVEQAIIALTERKPQPKPAPPQIVVTSTKPSEFVEPVAETKADLGDELAPTPVPDDRPITIDNVPITHDAPPSPAPVRTPTRLSYALPPLKLLEDPVVGVGEDEKHLREVGNLLEKTFADFGLTIRVVGIHTGPVVTQYEIALETGLRVSRVTSLSEDLALNLKVPSVRIVAPLPGRNTVGIEVPNENRAVVRLKELLNSAAAKVEKSKLPMLLGKDSEGRPLVYDLADMPHLLIAGRTGTGKSVCLNSIILSVLLTRTPEQCRLLMIDPKQVELAEYGKLPHLLHPVVTKNEKAEALLAWAVDKMEDRYELLRKARVRNIVGYNELGYDELQRRLKPADDAEAELIPEKLPYIVIIVDEVGDLMMAMKKEVEGHIIRLAQKSRAAGIHLILTTQRPTVDIITGLIKSNLPARICFQVSDRSNSRVVLDEVGAEKLLGKGDMLFLQPNTSTIVRAQGSYASDHEILKVVSHLEVDEPDFDNEIDERLSRDSGAANANTPPPSTEQKRDPLYEQAVEIVLREGRGSVSLLQRALAIGYGRSARLIDFMAEDGIVGHYNGAQAREVLLSPEQWAARRAGQPVEATTNNMDATLDNC